MTKVRFSNGGNSTEQEQEDEELTVAQNQARKQRQEALDRKQKRKDLARLKIIIGGTVLKYGSDKLKAGIKEHVINEKISRNTKLIERWDEITKKE